ncbi:MAG: hypothetical protein MMC33_001607 [Icmadophila ericetorum]|nr:hypothetical protein [Icmadophila ericetorum]
MSSSQYPPSADMLRKHSAGFNEQAFNDPFLLATPHDELQEPYNQLLPQNPHLYPQMPTDHREDGFEGNNSTYTNHYGMHMANGVQSISSNLQHSMLGHPGITNHAPYSTESVHSLSGMSPADQYSSDYTSPNDEDFELERNYGPLEVPMEAIDFSTVNPEQLSYHSSTTGFFLASSSAQTSAGFSSHASQLMSPELTDTTSPESSYEAMSPIVKTRMRLLGGGVMSRISSQSTTTEPATSLYRNTPALTGTSVERSPEPASGPENATVGSPIVRIEYHHRGDSPARVDGSLLRSGSKRSRSSSHLAAPYEDSSDEDDMTTERYQTYDAASSAGQPQLVNGIRGGVDPAARTQIADEKIASLKDQKELQEQEARRAEVHEWLANSSSASPDVPPDVPAEVSTPVGDRKYQNTSGLRRAKSTGDKSRPTRLSVPGSHQRQQRPNATNSKIPPRESSIDGEADVDTEGSPKTPLAHSEMFPEGSKPKHEENLHNEGIYQEAHPWADPIYWPSRYNEFHVKPDQPATAAQAMQLFMQRAQDLESASRRATWATSVRRLSETDLDRLLGTDGLFSRLSISADKLREKVDRRGSSIATKLRRNHSVTKRKGSEPTDQGTEQSASPNQSRKESLQESFHRRKESLRGLGRNNSQHDRKDSGQEGSAARVDSTTALSGGLRHSPSAKRTKDPSRQTAGAVAVTTSHVAIVGANGSISPKAPLSPTKTSHNPFSSTRSSIRRRMSRGDSHRPSASLVENPGLTALWVAAGGPPVPTLASPPKEKADTGPFEPPPAVEDDEDAESDDGQDEQEVSAETAHRNIVPTLDGFKNNVKEVFPTLAPYLIDRLSQEQIRRYKRLVENKIKHEQAVHNHTCESKKRNHCSRLGGKPSYLPAKGQKGELDFSQNGFHISGNGSPTDLDGSTITEGAVSAAQFPEGVNPPPVERLPAEFECPLCFTVKKLQKPSDWSKHVHEDLQPFTCTFIECTDPKSFKRKADWVRHENERHRQLEWWTCNRQDCQHKCYRRDNFVQHLVREHKLEDPNAKTIKSSNRPAVRGPAKNKQLNGGLPDDLVASMVISCRALTTNKPQDEPCKFCGAVCSTWKKLTVHLARHMERLSIPVLRLVEEKDVEPSTIISPIEATLARSNNIIPTLDNRSFQREVLNAAQYDNTPIKQELSSPYTPTPNSSNFLGMPEYQATNASSAWTQANGQDARAQAGVSTMDYGPNVSAAYIPTSTSTYDYHMEARAGSFMPVNGQMSHMQGPSGPNMAYGFSGVNNHLAMPQAHYAENQTFLGMNQDQAPTNHYNAYANGQVYGPSPIAESGQHVAMGPQYGPTPDMNYPQGAVDNSSLYTSTNPDQSRGGPYYNYPV